MKLQEAYDKLRKKGYEDNVKHTEIIRQAIDAYLEDNNNDGVHGG